jgi:hypothetical protein
MRCSNPQHASHRRALHELSVKKELVKKSSERERSFDHA